MGKLIISEHITLDGFVAGTNGEMDWIGLDDDMFGYVGTLTETAGAALYGRKTYEIMDAYWPIAGDRPNATKHDHDHSAWYNNVDKIVLSDSMMGQDKDKIRFITGDMMDVVARTK